MDFEKVVFEYCIDHYEFNRNDFCLQVDKRLVEWNFDKVPPVCDYADDPYTLENPKYPYITTKDINWATVGFLDFKLEQETFDVKDRFVRPFVESSTGSRVLHLGGIHDINLYSSFVYYLNSLDSVGEIIIEIILKGYPMQVERGFDLYEPHNLTTTSKLKSIGHFSKTIEALVENPIDNSKYNIVYEMGLSAPCSIAFGNIDPDVLDKTKKTKWFIAPDFKK